MNNRKQSLKEMLKHIGARSIIMALFLFVITLGLAAFAWVRVFDKNKEVLMLQGELNTTDSALEYDRYLLTRVNTVTMAGYTVDKMLSTGAEGDGIEQYLTDETQYIIDTLDKDTTGLYGWIGGEYLDGSGWEPDDDYVATERPWYVQTIESDSAVTFVEPYLDAQTNTVMMTVSELLGDGVSVIAMDVSLEPVQEIVEQVASSTEGTQTFVMDKSGIVVAHSDKEQLGKNFLKEQDSLGSAVAREVLSDGKMQFDITTDEGSFSVYADELQGGWYSVSVINSDVWYRPLYRLMTIFTILLILVVVLLFFIFVRLISKNLALEKLHTQIDEEEKRGDELQALSETDRMTGLYDRVYGERRVNELLGSGTGGMFLELDIDHFKHINDTYGHQTGDLVIIAVADALRSSFRVNDVIMRLGGDEFGVLAIGIVGQDLGGAIIQRLFDHIDRLQIPEMCGEKFSVSVGAVISTGEGERSFSELYSRADEAMYVSKKNSGNSLTFRTIRQ